VSELERTGAVGRARAGLARAGRWLWAENLALVFAAIAVGAAELLMIRAIYTAGFGGPRRIPEAADLPLGHAVLWVTGLAGGALAGAAAYRLLRHGRAWLAALLVAAVCVPLLVLALASLYGSLLVAGFL
jgi:hypothetical protein